MLNLANEQLLVALVTARRLIGWDADIGELRTRLCSLAPSDQLALALRHVTALERHVENKISPHKEYISQIIRLEYAGALDINSQATLAELQSALEASRNNRNECEIVIEKLLYILNEIPEFKLTRQQPIALAHQPSKRKPIAELPGPLIPQETSPIIIIRRRIGSLNIPVSLENSANTTNIDKPASPQPYGSATLDGEQSPQPGEHQLVAAAADMPSGAELALHFGLPTGTAAWSSPANSAPPINRHPPIYASSTEQNLPQSSTALSIIPAPNSSPAAKSNSSSAKTPEQGQALLRQNPIVTACRWLTSVFTDCRLCRRSSKVITSPTIVTNLPNLRPKAAENRPQFELV
jgi:hypothetical protein